MTEPKKFNCLSASSKFAICGIPVRVDSYKTCPFGCVYCFSNNRKIMEFEKKLAIGNISQLEKTLKRIHDDGNVKENNFLDYLIADRITWHCGGMSDPFQPVEAKYHITEQIVELSKKYNHSILFSTKSDNLYGCQFDPELHSFQLSVTNVDDRTDLEPGVPSIESRKKLFDDLKSQGYKVGIRVQPFIPGVTDTRIVEMFENADHFTIEGLKLVPQNKEHTQQTLAATGLSKDMFTQMGLLNLRPEIRLEYYKEFLSALEQRRIPYSLADNDLHYWGCGNCCCGENLIKKSTKFNNRRLCYNHGREYSLDDVYDSLEQYKDCNVKSLFTSNRTEGCKTVWDFYQKRFDRKSSPFSPKFLFDETSLIEGPTTI